MLQEVLRFVDSSSGLTCQVSETGNVQIQQSLDGKTFRFQANQLSEILPRVDADGKQFIQVNFQSGIKILITETLVGFKPQQTSGLDMAKIPRVVTTPDLISVLEAIEESMSADDAGENEVEILKKVFHSILQGGEGAGFDLSFERRWLTRLTSTRLKASA